MSKRSKACEFSRQEREIIHMRDGGCIFCRMNYHNDEISDFEKHIYEIMHYIPRSAGGLGIRQNAAVGCKGHHIMMDNGNTGRRQEMLDMFQGYLKRRYPGWNEEELKYNKWQK